MVRHVLPEDGSRHAVEGRFKDLANARSASRAADAPQQSRRDYMHDKGAAPAFAGVLNLWPEEGSRPRVFRPGRLRARR